MTSAESSTALPVQSGSGSISLSGEVLGEELARELLARRFGDAGLAIQHDYQFHHKDTSLILDGFDPLVNIGYQYLSHTDADVVTDHDVAADVALRELAGQRRVRVLVVHDVDVRSPGDLLDRIDAFFDEAGLARPPR